MSGSRGEVGGERGAERAAGPGDHDDPSRHTSRYPPSTFRTAPVTNAEASDARNWYAPARSVASPHRCCAVCPRIAADSFGLFFHPSASGESNQPGRDDVHGDAGGRQVERQALGQAHQPGLRRAVRREALARPLAQHRAGEDEAPAVAHDASRGARAEEGRREVHLEHLAPDRRVGLARTGHDRRDAGVADPDVDAAPLGHGGVGDRLVERLVGDVAAAHERRPGELGGDALQVGLGAGDERHERAGLREPVREQPTEAPARAGEDHALAPDVAATRQRRRDLDLFGSSSLPVLYRPVQ